MTTPPRRAALDDAAERLIEINDLSKSFGHVRALDHLDLHLERGEVLGFLGPNGAGKSTTIRVLLGLLRRDGGTVRLFGQDPWTRTVELHRRLAYVPGDVSLWPSMTGGEAIDLLGSLRGGLDRARRAELLERFDLDPTKRGRQYSKGNRQKVAIVAALASDAELLILDEPTSGLDPLMEEVFQTTVREATDRGVSVLLSSHIMSEVESLADRIAIIRAGTVIRTGTLDDLRSDVRSTVRADLVAPPDPQQVETLKRAMPGAEITGTHLTALVDDISMNAAMRVLTDIGTVRLAVEPPSLESLFLRLYQDAGHEDA